MLLSGYRCQDHLQLEIFHLQPWVEWHVFIQEQWGFFQIHSSCLLSRYVSLARKNFAQLLLVYQLFLFQIWSSLRQLLNHMGYCSALYMELFRKTTWKFRLLQNIEECAIKSILWYAQYDTPALLANLLSSVIQSGIYDLLSPTCHRAGICFPWYHTSQFDPIELACSEFFHSSSAN